MIRIALDHPAISSKIPFSRSLPIRLRELVNCSNGNIANGKLHRQHYLAQREQIVHAVVAAQPMTMTAGRIASAGDQPPHPWPNAPVHEAFHHHLSGERPCDGAALSAASRATAKSVLASAVPSNGASVRYATRIQSLSGPNVTTCPPAP